MTAACSLASLTKYYGSQIGIEDVSFEVQPGELFGFLGANGAGKTTTMRVLMGLMRPTRGQALLFGEDAIVHGPRLRAEVGYLPGQLSLYTSLTGREYLDFLSHLRRRDCRRNYESLAQRLDLDLSRRIRELSKGNRQKVGLVSAFMHEPKLLVLDEATGGLDPLVQREFEGMIRDVRARGGSLLFSSHVLSDVEHQADRVAVLHRGRLVRVSTMEELRAQARHSMELEFPGVPDMEGLRRLPGVVAATSHDHVVTCVVRGDEHELLAEAVRQGVTAVRTHEQSLEDVFFEIIGGGDDRAHDAAEDAA